MGTSDDLNDGGPGGMATPMTTSSQRGTDAPRSPRRLRALLVLVIGSGVLSMAAAVVQIDSRPHPVLWKVALAVAVFVLADAPVFEIRLGHDRNTFTWSEASVVLGLVLLPLPWLRLLAPLGVAITHLTLRRQPLKVAFNAASF